MSNMSIRFLGFRQADKKGCSVCGKKRTSDWTFKREKRMVLPSGRNMTFFMGRTYEVNHLDGEFLMEQTYLMNGAAIKMFEEVV